MNAPQSPRIPVALLWDMDGTIIDTEPYWIVAECELAAQFGTTWTQQDGLDVVGQGLPYTATRLRERGVALELDDIIENLTSRVLDQLTGELPWRPGALDMLMAAHEAGYRQALVTMSISRMARHIASLVPNRPFEFVVSGSDVAHSKPAPDAYHLAASLLDVDIAQCVAFEDSPSGCTSAFTANAVTIGIPHLVSLEDTPRDHILTSLENVSLGDVEELYRASRVSVEES